MTRALPNRHRRFAAMSCSLLLVTAFGSRVSAAEATPASTSVRQSGEVDLLGERGVQVSVDGQPPQVLPLSAPLSMAAGSHTITATLDRKTLTSTVSVRAGRALEVRFNFDVQAVSVTTPPHALLIEKYEGLPPQVVEELAVTTVRALSKQRLAVLIPPASASIPPGCTQQAPCLVSQAVTHESDYAITVSVAPNAQATGAETQSYQIEARVIDRSVEQEAARISDSCNGCGTVQLGEKLRLLTTTVASKALARGKSTVVIQTEPPNATIQIDGVPLGQSPLRRLMFTGSIRVDASLAKHRSASTRVMLRDGGETAVNLTLQPEEQIEAQKRRVIVIPRDIEVQREPRPRWRIIAGAVGMGVGAVLIGFGAGALSVDGQCIANPEGLARHCDNLYNTLPLGAGLVGAGGAVFVAGGLLLAWPGKAKPAPPLALERGN